jgi:hypothetical protein
MAVIVVAVPENRVIVRMFLLRSGRIAVLFPRSMRMQVHPELFYALGSASAALARAYYAV